MIWPKTIIMQSSMKYSCCAHIQFCTECLVKNEIYPTEPWCFDNSFSEKQFHGFKINELQLHALIPALHFRFVPCTFAPQTSLWLFMAKQISSDAIASSTTSDPISTNTWNVDFAVIVESFIIRSVTKLTIFSPKVGIGE